VVAGGGHLIPSPWPVHIQMTDFILILLGFTFGWLAHGWHAKQKANAEALRGGGNGEEKQTQRGGGNGEE